MPPLQSFTLREDRARSAYSVKAGADRLACAVSFDDEDAGDPASVIGPLPLRLDTPRPHRARFAVPPPAPTAAYDEEEITNVEFSLSR